MAAPGDGFEAGFAAAVFAAGGWAGFAAGVVFAARLTAGFAAGLALAFAGVEVAVGLTAGVALAGGAFDLAAAAAGFEAFAAFAFAGAVVFVAFATSSLPRSFCCLLLLRRLDVVRRPPLQRCRGFPEIQRVIYLLRLSAAVQVLPQRQDGKDLPSKSFPRCQLRQCRPVISVAKPRLVDFWLTIAAVNEKMRSLTIP
ncbi:hypothetical protein NKH47_18940 [Mesorhizobium sp. M1060]|uniref:hypothetical protein n=1 Tax=Mesorhizobium sp. M1060 TaxID=2957052 RepID=UPI0033374787